MKDHDINRLVKHALDEVVKNDIWLISNNLSEQSISNKIAYYLVPLFEGYNIDCEYNGDIENENNRKAISILKDRLLEFDLLRENEANNLENEFTIRAVFPDIIIHERGNNKNNLCIIEVKKNTSTISYDYDFIKLQSYTSDSHNNNLKYQLGIFIEVITGNKEPGFSLSYFKNGENIGSVINLTG